MDRLAQTALSALRQMQDNKFDVANKKTTNPYSSAERNSG